MKIKALALLAASAIALAACSGSKDAEQAPAETNVTDLTVVPEDSANVLTEAPPATRIDNTATSEVEPPAATLTADEQTQDDADAAGMTAKVDRSGDAEEPQPAK
ncbi:MAG: hypothetical protein EOP60_09640 [Sphingomonadales bacterium]|nr:MAG: hypothetical protein EOP60_09640 [Sphingomonadales bacterium]